MRLLFADDPGANKSTQTALLLRPVAK